MNVLLLQGPVGPFFKRFAQDLAAHGNLVYKINFNAGDRLFHHGERCFEFTGPIDSWAEYLSDMIAELAIGRIYLFGDTRGYHRIAFDVARVHSVPVFAFEEGYLRPHYITLEKDGVNGRSQISKDPSFYANLPTKKAPQSLAPSKPFRYTAWFATLYFLACWHGRKLYPHYRHHRPCQPYREMVIWILAFLRLHYYRFTERKILPRLAAQESKNYFLVPLQVHNDAQIKSWSSVPSAAAFIKRVIKSFVKNASQDKLLVIKHHPLDRGYSNYAQLIRKLADKYKCSDRIIYVHDLHLPTLLDHACGTVVLNSTVGISSILHGTPVKTSGHAIYDFPGLTHQGDLKSFWQDTGSIDQKLNQQFRNYLLENNQINGNFYQRIEAFPYHCGIDLGRHLHSMQYEPCEAPVAVQTTATAMQRKESSIDVGKQKTRGWPLNPLHKTKLPTGDKHISTQRAV